jgi:isopropylmalate/homocitrate/citramalate synthase
VTVTCEEAGVTTDGLVRREDSIAAANVMTAAFDETIRHPIVLHDDTLRDGEQTVGVRFSVEQKVEIARMLLDSGVPSIVLGFPAIGEEEREAIRAILALEHEGHELWCLSRASRKDIDTTAECGVRNIALFVPSSDLHLAHKLRMSEDEAFERITSAVRHAASLGLRVRAGCEDASRTPMPRLVRFIEGVVDAGAHLTMVADTVGVLTPLATYRWVRELVAVSGGAPLSVHFHDDLGMATANTITAALAGATVLMGSFAGLGERAGNTCLEEVAVALRVKYGLDLGVDLIKLTRTARRAAEIAGMPVPPCKPILGAKVFSHEAGIHVHGVTSEPATYEPFPPELIGRRHEIHYGKHSGLHSMRYLARRLGLEVGDDVLERALDAIKRHTAAHGAPTPDQAGEILLSAVAAATAPPLRMR